MTLKAFTIGAVVADGTTLPGVTNSGTDPGITQLLLRGGGHVEPEFGGAQEVSPTFSWSNFDIATAVAVIGIDGDAVTSAYALYFAQKADGGATLGASNAIKFNVAKGLAVLRTIGGSQAGGDALASFELIPTSDGINPPYTVTTSQALPADAVSAAAFDIGPVWLNGVKIEPQSVVFDTGIEVMRLGASGAVWTQFASIISMNPTLTLIMSDAEYQATLGTDGIPVASNAAFFRSRVQGGGHAADAATSHVKIDFEVANAVATSLDGSSGDQAPLNVVCNLIFDGTNPIGVIGTGAIAAPS